MKKNYIYIGILVVFIISLLNLFIGTHIHKRKALQVVTTVLEQWQNLDLVRAIDQWEDPKTYPSVYSLDSFEITEKTFGKKDGEYIAHVYVRINFDRTNKVMPSGKEWAFELVHTSLGWKVRSFKMSYRN